MVPFSTGCHEDHSVLLCTAKPPTSGLKCGVQRCVPSATQRHRASEMAPVSLKHSWRSIAQTPGSWDQGPGDPLLPLTVLPPAPALLHASPGLTAWTRLWPPATGNTSPAGWGCGGPLAQTSVRLCLEKSRSSLEVHPQSVKTLLLVPFHLRFYNFRLTC